MSPQVQQYRERFGHQLVTRFVFVFRVSARHETLD
jgi:hypothetical protein